MTPEEQHDSATRDSSLKLNSVPDALPPITVILPVLNESAHIDACLETLARQDYPGPVTVVVADGGSEDDTVARLEGWRRRLPGLEVIHNPDRRQSPGLNLAAAAAPGEILIRADGHTEYAPDYVLRSVQALVELGPGWAVGGNMRPVGRTGFGKAVAAAMRSRFVSPARFHQSRRRSEVDTVYLGSFRRDEYLALGGLRSFPSGSSEDADFYFRWRKSGRRVLLDPDVRSTYRPRERVGSLWRQYFRYGQGKTEMLYANGRLPSWRPLAPLALVMGLGGTGGLAVFKRTVAPFGVMAATWGVVLVGVGVRADGPALPVAGATALMHLGYGLGTVWGLLRGRRRATPVARGEADQRPR